MFMVFFLPLKQIKLDKPLVRKHLSYISKNNKYVPHSEPLGKNSVNKLLTFFDQNKNQKLMTLTGAGISTESDIPDYRSPKTGVYEKSNNLKIRLPVTFQEFYHDPFFRKKFWARHYLGYMIYNSKNPNISHKVLARWRKIGLLKFLITQNVDDLHQKAGMDEESMIQLHGNFQRVICLKCGSQYSRKILQEQLTLSNSNWKFSILSKSSDAYTHITENDAERFIAPSCTHCGSDYLKPEVVFIGENVKPQVIQKVDAWIKESDYLLVLGSSLTMYSSYRIVSTFYQSQKPIAIINIGGTRADNLANVKIDARLGEILPEVDEKIIN